MIKSDGYETVTDDYCLVFCLVHTATTSHRSIFA
jgi:hypothetical protein